MSVPPDTHPTAVLTQPCASCGAPLAHDQRYCLHCGEVRPGAQRPFTSVVRTESTVRESAVDVAAVAPHRWPTLAEALAGLACLLLALGVGVVIGRSGNDSPAAPAAITVAAGPAATPVATAFISDWPTGKDGWTVALDALPKASTQPDATVAAKTAATSQGAPEAGVLDADLYPSLTAGSYVVYSGVYDSKQAATKELSALKSSFSDARVVRVGASADAADAAKTASGGGSSEPTPTQKKSTGKAAAADTKKEFERSKKVPKTVVIPGKAPPKDNKPPGGGAESEEIG